MDSPGTVAAGSGDAGAADAGNQSSVLRSQFSVLSSRFSVFCFVFVLGAVNFCTEINLPRLGGIFGLGCARSVPLAVPPPPRIVYRQCSCGFARLQLHTGEFDLCFQWLTGKILNLKDLRVRILAEIAQNGTLPDLSAVMASTIIARFNFGRKVRCHNGAVEIDSVADAGFLGRSLYPASKSPLLAKDARKGAPNFEGSADLLHLLIARKIVSHFVLQGRKILPRVTSLPGKRCCRSAPS